METQHIRDTPPASWMEMSFFFFYAWEEAAHFPSCKWKKKKGKAGNAIGGLRELCGKCCERLRDEHSPPVCGAGEDRGSGLFTGVFHRTKVGGLQSSSPALISAKLVCQRRSGCWWWLMLICLNCDWVGRRSRGRGRTTIVCRRWDQQQSSSEVCFSKIELVNIEREKKAQWEGTCKLRASQNFHSASSQPPDCSSARPYVRLWL